LFAWLWEFEVEMAEEASKGSRSFVVENIPNVYHLKIDVVNFNRTNNFRL